MTTKITFKKKFVPVNNVSPLRYPGGKTRARKKLDEILSQYININELSYIISPFFGGGSFEFYLQNKYNLFIIANDKFTPLYHFWNQAKINKTSLITTLKPYLHTVTKNNFLLYRNTIMSLDNPLTQALYYFIINRCSFSGSTLSGGFSQQSSQKRFTMSSINRIENLNLHYTSFYNVDFSTFLNMFSNKPKALIFLDPPYYLKNNSNLYGLNGDLHEGFDHQKLFNITFQNQIKDQQK